MAKRTIPLRTEAIWDTFDAGLRRFILKRISDRGAAEDVLQEVYLRIHSRIATLRDRRKLHGWIYQIAHNAITDYYRSSKATTELPEALSPPEAPDDNDAARELAPSVRAMIDTLPDKYRQALILTEYQGLTQEQMARQLGLSVSGAKSRVQRAREKLKDMLLACCHFQLDRRGNILTYQPRCRCCADSRSGAGCPSTPDQMPA